MNPVKAGDLLYNVGDAPEGPHGSAGLRIYNTIVMLVRPDGTIELNADRPVLGFPRWIYHEHEIGFAAHRSAADALRAFTKHAQLRRGEAEHALKRADHQLKWAADEAIARMEIQ